MSKALECAHRQLSAGSIGSYIHWVNQFPMLSKEKEQELAYRLRDHGDLEAARELIVSHLRLVVKMARGYSGYGLSQADLIQEGNIGLMKAVKRFNPDVGVRLVSFALHWIRAEMHEYILRNWRIVKVATTKAQRKLFFNLRKYSKKLGWFSPAEVDVVASELNVPHSEVRKMEQRLSGYDEAFDASTDDSNEDSAWKAPAHYLEDQSISPELQLEKDDWANSQNSKLALALEKLDDRSRDILQSRWLTEDKKVTLMGLAEKYQVSAERIRQLEKAAFKKLRESITTS